MIRREDGGHMMDLSENSHKKVIFNCDVCNEEYTQSYQNYNKQKPGKLCYTCRRKEIASRKEVKEKQSKAAKKFHENATQETKERLNEASRQAQNRRWAKIPKEERNKNCLIPFQRYIDFFSNHPTFTLLSTEETYLATKKIEYTCPNGHLNTERFSTTGSGKPPCKQCVGVNIDKIKEELTNIGHEFISFEKTTSQYTLTVKCDKGHIFSKTYGNWKKDHSCKVCAGNSSDINEIIKEFGKVGYEVVNDNNFRGAIKRHEFTLKCEKGHIFNLSYFSFKNRKRCEECNKIEKYEEMKKAMEVENYTLLDTYEEFYQNKPMMKFKCENGHIQEIHQLNWKRGIRCKTCY